jgi:mannitol-1-phosphate 5-dehydrogenase
VIRRERLTGTRTYVGFGFGAIQAGLFLYEAYNSRNFDRLVVVEVLPDQVSNLRRAGGMYSLNIAHPDRIESVRVGPVEIYDPAVEADRERLIAAVAGAHAIGTAIPSVNCYRSPGPGSLHRLMAKGLRRKTGGGGPDAVIYAAENHNHAAEILQDAVLSELPLHEQQQLGTRIQFLNTVIGKMSGVVTEPEAIREHGLATTTPQDHRAFLVEAFNRILIGKVQTQDSDKGPVFRRGIEVFEEKQDLLPFEEAKLYGHNATHALAAYIGAMTGARRITDLATVPGSMPFLRAAFINESGAALVRKHAGVDPLFTNQGYARYADDLLERMTNPFLLDTIERVGRDPARKLGWNDRLVGTMRLALGQGIEPRRYAFGAAAALVALDRSLLEDARPLRPLLDSLWQTAAPSEEEKEAVRVRIEAGMIQLRTWRDSGLGHLENLFVRVANG